MTDSWDEPEVPEHHGSTGQSPQPAAADTTAAARRAVRKHLDELAKDALAKQLQRPEVADRLAEQVAHAVETDLNPAPDTEPTGPRYSSVEQWVTEWLAPLVRRTVNTQVAGTRLAWCPQWWRHPEAIDRLEAIWRAWEAARMSEDPAAVAGWWLYTGDPMLAVLFDHEHGPFGACGRGEHRDPPALPVEPAPAGWWGETRAPQAHDGTGTDQ